MKFFNGILSDKFKNRTHLGESIAYYLCFVSGHTFFANTIVFSLADGQPVKAWRDIFLHITSPSLPGWVEVPYNKYLHIYIVYCFLVYTLCGATALHPLNFKEVSDTPLLETVRSYLWFDLKYIYMIVPSPYKKRVLNGLVVWMTSSFGTKKLFKSF